MNNLEFQKEITPPQENLGEKKTDRLGFLDDPQFADIKNPLTKTINNLADENIITPEEKFRKNIEQITKDIFSDPLFEFDVIAKENQANDIFLFRTKFEEIKKENLKNIKEEQTENKEEQTENKEEQTENKEEQTENKEEQTENKEEQTENKEEQTENKEEQTENKEEYRNELRENLNKQYTTIETQYKHKDQDEFNNFKNQTKFQDIIQKLPSDKIDDYFKHRFTAEKIVKEARNSKNKTISVEHYTFIQKFNTLDQQLNLNSKIEISDLKIERQESKRLNTMNDIITNDKIGEEVFARNENIQNFVQENKDTIPDENKAQLFPLENIKTKIIERYPEKIEAILDEILINNNLTQYKENFSPDGTLQNTEKINEEDKKDLKKISEKISEEIGNLAKEEQERIFQETNKVIKTKAIETLIKNIGQYFQITNFDRKNIAKQVNIDVENGINLDKNILTLSTNMEGKDIRFYYDIQNGETRADDFIAFEGIEGTREDGIYHINKNQDKKGREKLFPKKMDTLNQILTESKSKTTENIIKAIEKSNTPQQYQNKLSENTNIFSPKESSIGNITIEHAMEKNIAVQNIHDFVTQYIPTRNTYNQKTEKYEYNLYKIIDTTFDRYTAEEIRTRNNLFQRFQNKINEKNPSFKDPLIRSLFDEITANQQKKGEYDTEKGPNIYQFLQGITNENGNIIKEQVIDLNLFAHIVDELESVEGETYKLKNKSNKYKKLRNDFEENTTKQEAENINFDAAYGI